MPRLRRFFEVKFGYEKIIFKSINLKIILKINNLNIIKKIKGYGTVIGSL